MVNAALMAGMATSLSTFSTSCSLGSRLKGSSVKTSTPG
jgi:hypothetical protein